MDAGDEKKGNEESLHNKLKTDEHGSSGLSMDNRDERSRSPSSQELMDQEAALLQESNTTTDLESVYNSLMDGIIKNHDRIMDLREDMKTIKSELSSISLTLSAILTKVSHLGLNPNPSIPATPNRITVPPRAQLRLTNSVDRPSTSRDRSRSPIAPRVIPTSKPLHISQSVRCSFCNSSTHLSRNCSVIKSVSTRSSLMALNQCRRCFRYINASHSPTCAPEDCVRGCVDEDGVPLQHMQTFCPLNPDLQP